MSCKIRRNSFGWKKGKKKKKKKKKKVGRYCIDFISAAMFNKDRIDFPRNQLHAFSMKLLRALFFLNMCHIFDTNVEHSPKERKEKKKKKKE